MGCHIRPFLAILGALILSNHAHLAAADVDTGGEVGGKPRTLLQEEKPPIKVVHLGDSYSAGNAAGEYWGPRGCFRSKNNWGERISNGLADRYAVTYINRACSGSETEHYWNEYTIDSKFYGPVPEAAWDERYTFTKNIIFRDYWMTTVKPQKENLDPDTDLVLMSFGGNDIGFGDVVEGCFAPAVRDPRKCSKAIAAGLQKKDSLKDRLVKVFDDMSKRVKPDALVLLASYPYITQDRPEYTVDCFLWIGCGDFFKDKPATTQVREASDRLDEAQKAAVKEINQRLGREFVIFFDQTKEIFRGHEASPFYNNPNGNRWIKELEGNFMDFDTKMEMYHPLKVGHTNWGGGMIISLPTGSLNRNFRFGTTRSISKPVAWAGDGYVAKIGEKIRFDARGSYHPSGALLDKVEWDFDGNSKFEYTTKQLVTYHTYKKAFEGWVRLRIYSGNQVDTTKVYVVVNKEGSVDMTPNNQESPGKYPDCKLDKYGFSVVYDKDGDLKPCYATNLRTVNNIESIKKKAKKCLAKAKKECGCSGKKSKLKNCYSDYFDKRCKRSYTKENKQSTKSAYDAFRKDICGKKRK